MTAMRRAPVLLILLAACSDDESIRRYQVPKAPPPPERHTHAPETVADGMLVAIFTRPEHTWFFKATADGARLDAIRPAFRELIASVRFAEPKVEWSLPPGWRTEPGSEMRYAGTGLK